MLMNLKNHLNGQKSVSLEYLTPEPGLPPSHPFHQGKYWEPLTSLPPHTKTSPHSVSHRGSLQGLAQLQARGRSRRDIVTSVRGAGWSLIEKGLGLSFQKFTGVFQSTDDSQKPVH